MKLTDEQLKRLDLLQALKARSVITPDELQELDSLVAMQNDEPDPSTNMAVFCSKNHKLLAKLAKEGKFDEYDKIILNQLNRVKDKYKNLFNSMNVSYMQPYFETNGITEVTDLLVNSCKTTNANGALEKTIDGVLDFDTCVTKEQRSVREYGIVEEAQLAEKLVESCNAFPFPVALRTVEVTALAKLPIIIQYIYHELGVKFDQKHTPDIAVMKLALGIIHKACKRALTSIADIHLYADEIYEYADSEVTSNYLSYTLKNK